MIWDHPSSRVETARAAIAGQGGHIRLEEGVKETPNNAGRFRTFPLC